ncbi:hypothetical protein BO94DRAFT_236043 [Aspergillus sclerotioniger CBS 115572]|uniref:Serine/threonine-protein kinase ppk6 n=1 Tax=Aspergillus sclerotioniger CBS 115572 TaxID=1450535 RepID=A0A317VHI7_9EURO|nr:hypothetical protein BO94DRAFT_236043 [Aspergillus sclerotioniger CBS 115572]PWY73826.1 hypothetical protein BO94DRAFT_236043 [Aspergillus sclerotioniger CBS 115572]
MSADLFAEFGMGSAPPQPRRDLRQHSAGFQSLSLIPDLDAFEDPSIRSSSDLNKTATKPAHVEPSWTQSAFERPGTSGLPQYGHGNDNVLFDATLESVPDDESDDWGEFETADVPTIKETPHTALQPRDAVKGRRVLPTPSKRTTVFSAPLIDSLSIDDNIPSSGSTPTAAPNRTVPKARRKEPPSVASPLPTQEDPFEEWGDFVDGPFIASSQTGAPSTPAPTAQRPRGNGRKVSENIKSPAGSTSSFQTASLPTMAAQVRPTNIPPPSVLLELFPQLLDELRQEATKARKDLQQKDQLENTASLIICTLKTAARVVAGRTLRWKRDSILSQSMRIGPARAGKPGGMKLNTVNKNEDIKEQQEAVDVLTMWRDRTALFNSIIQAAGRHPVQVIPENIRVMTYTANQGALKASHACALCGLKRDERLPRIDGNVEDSFGEWWTDHWGHTDCRQFWEKNRSLLGQR